MDIRYNKNFLYQLQQICNQNKCWHPSWTKWLWLSTGSTYMGNCLNSSASCGYNWRAHEPSTLKFCLGLFQEKSHNLFKFKDIGLIFLLYFSRNSCLETNAPRQHQFFNDLIFIGLKLGLKIFQNILYPCDSIFYLLYSIQRVKV